jgi:hypothetical protein
MLCVLAVKHGQGRAGVIQKTAKAEKAAELHAKFADVKGVVLSDYCGLNVQQMSELRRQLRAVSVEFHVVKKHFGSTCHSYYRFGAIDRLSCWYDSSRFGCQ